MVIINSDQWKTLIYSKLQLQGTMLSSNWVYVFSYTYLFNNIVSISDYVMQNGGLINEYELQRYEKMRSWPCLRETEKNSNKPQSG
jgi:hypothetical protein